MSRYTIVAIYVLVPLIVKFLGYEWEPIRGVMLVALVISLILYEIYERRKNIKNGGSKFHEKILVRKDKECYLSMALAFSGMIIFLIIAVLVMKQYNLYGEGLKNVGVISLIILAFFYGYLYIVSNQILYKDGILLADNRFLSKDYIEEVVYRRTIIKNKRIIEINTNRSAKISRNQIEIKCENEEEFIKIIEAFEGITGAKARNLEW